MAGRIAMTILLATGLLLPGRFAAAEQADTSRTTPSFTAEIERLGRRIAELEKAKVAQEDATRAIIRESLDRSTSKINSVAAFGGTFEVLGGRTQDFAGVRERVLRLNTLECGFEVQVNDWTLTSFILQYNDGSGVVFPTVDGGTAGVGRIDVDTAVLTMGDTQRFPVYGTLGRMILPFGISTGDPVADVPTLEDPLTLEAFEMLEDGVMLGVGLPTPPVTPQTSITAPPAVRPRAVRPLFEAFGRSLGYRPPPVVIARPGLVSPITPPPPLRAGILLYHGNTVGRRRLSWSPEQHWGATVGYRTSGPWSFDANVDYNSSIFDSRFLEVEYGGFLDEIGLVPGMASSVKAKLGRVGVVTEWNGAIKKARFQDDADRDVVIRPSAWQIGMVYQFDWNSGVESLASQGTYLAFGYSRSRDLAGATRIIGTTPVRVGAVPQQRFMVGAGEWILDGLRLAVEYSHARDYPVNRGGTGRSAHGVLSMLTYDW